MEPSFNHGAISEVTWNDIQDVIDYYSVSSVLEIGAGSSTLLLSKKVKSVTSLETSKLWIDKLSESISNNVRLIKYTYPNFPNEACGCYDMAFVDGPAGNTEGRLHSMKFASVNSNIILIHDSCRKYEKESIASTFIEGLWNLTRMADGLTVAVRSMSGVSAYVAPKTNKKKK